MLKVFNSHHNYMVKGYYKIVYKPIEKISATSLSPSRVYRIEYNILLTRCCK